MRMKSVTATSRKPIKHQDALVFCTRKFSLFFPAIRNQQIEGGAYFRYFYVVIGEHIFKIFLTNIRSNLNLAVLLNPIFIQKSDRFLLFSPRNNYWFFKLLIFHI